MSYKLKCNGYDVKLVQKESDIKLISYCAEQQNEYLANDLKVKGQYLRIIVEQRDEQNFLVKYPSGQILEQIIKDNGSLSEQTIITILVQILEGLATLYRNKVMGRCFNINNIIWDEVNITMMNFGFYPDIDQVFNEDDHKLDTLLLGQIAYCLITRELKVKSNYQNKLEGSGISQQLRELTVKMLEQSNERISLQEVVKYFEKNLSIETIYFYINNYQDCCKALDQIMKERIQLTDSQVEEIQFEEYGEDQKKQENMHYLLYQNKIVDENYSIWKQLHDELYRIYLLTNLKQIIQEQYFNQGKWKYKDQLNFIVDKTILIVMLKFERYLSTQFSKDQFTTLSKVLRSKIMMEKSFFSSYDLDLIKKYIKKDTEKHFTTDIFENEFDDIKLCFRRYVLDVYRYFEKNVNNCMDPQEKLECSIIQLRILLALILNQVMKNKDIHFKTLKQVVGTQKLSLDDIEIKFFQLANVEQIQQQISEIIQTYFI